MLIAPLFKRSLRTNCTLNKRGLNMKTEINLKGFYLVQTIGCMKKDGILRIKFGDKDTELKIPNFNKEDIPLVYLYQCKTNKSNEFIIATHKESSKLFGKYTTDNKITRKHKTDVPIRKIVCDLKSDFKDAPVKIKFRGYTMKHKPRKRKFTKRVKLNHMVYFSESFASTSASLRVSTCKSRAQYLKIDVIPVLADKKVCECK